VYTIDAHTHILPPDVIASRAEFAMLETWFAMLHASPRSRFACAPDLIASMDRAGIDASVAFGFAFRSPDLCRRCNDYVLESAAHWPARIIPLAVVSPLEPGAVAEAARCLDAGARGIGELLPDGQGFGLEDTALAPLLDLARERGVPVMLHVNELVGHTYPGKGQVGPEHAYALAVRWPGLRLILAHWGGGLPMCELMPSARPALTDVSYDTAASPLLYDDRVFAEVSRWAPDKALFGTDYPLLSQRRFLRRVLALDMPDDTRRALLAGNALRVLGLPWPAGEGL
jgi:predicted TIM-barrel fold metal-dependent hydrolase